MAVRMAFPTVLMLHTMLLTVGTGVMLEWCAQVRNYKGSLLEQPQVVTYCCHLLD